MNIENKEGCGEIMGGKVIPRYNYYMGYDKSPALSVDKVKEMAKSMLRVIGVYIGGLNYESSDRGEGNKAISFTKEVIQGYLLIPSIKVAYIYVGRSDQDVSIKIPDQDPEAVSKGVTDAREAERLAKALDVPDNSVIYLDVEGGNKHNEAVVAYVKSWVETINNKTSYWAGIYCNYGSATASPAKQLYEAVNHEANMYVARWYAKGGSCYDIFTGETYVTSKSNPAKWFDINPEDRVPGTGCIVYQYSGNVWINLQGVQTIVDQISSTVPDPNVKQF